MAASLSTPIHWKPLYLSYEMCGRQGPLRLCTTVIDGDAMDFPFQNDHSHQHPRTTSFFVELEHSNK